MLAAIKYIIILIIIVVLGAGFWYISNLQANLAVAKQNEEKLTESIEAQQRLIEGMQKDMEEIQAANKELNTKVAAAQKDADNLAEKFNKRDFGTISNAKPKVAQKLVNRGTVNALRCVEIASGAPLTEQEINAKTQDEINRECPGIANPNYTPTTP